MTQAYAGAADRAAPRRSRRGAVHQDWTRPRPAYVFDPRDVWTASFHRGLALAGLAGQTVYEVGVGSGASVAYLLQQCNAGRVIGSDIDERVLAYAKRALRGPLSQGRARLIERPVSLLGSAAAREAAARAHMIVGNLPQALWLNTGGDSPQLPDACAHYYKGSSVAPSRFNAFGLGLNETLLRQARQAAPAAQVLLTVSGRASRALAERMFADCGYLPVVLLDVVVRQCARTRLHFFADLEARAAAISASTGVAFSACEFFLDANARQPIDARTALALQCDGPSVTPVFHRLLVIAGAPIG